MLVEVPTRGVSQGGPEAGQSPGRSSGPRQAFPVVRGHLGSDSDTWHLPSGKRPTLPTPGWLPARIGQMAPQSREAAEGRGGARGSRTGASPDAFTGQVVLFEPWRWALFLGKGKACTCTTPQSPLAASFQRNLRFRKNLIKHLLCSLILHGMELLMKLGSSLTRCWGSVALLRWGGGALPRGFSWTLLELMGQPSSLWSSSHPNPSQTFSQLLQVF